MPNSLFNRFGNIGMRRNQQMPSQRPQNNILSQLMSLRNNPGGILDILLQSGKINQQQYTELQPYRNNPEAIGKYLIRSGNGGEISKAEQQANTMVNR